MPHQRSNLESIHAHKMFGTSPLRFCTALQIKASQAWSLSGLFLLKWAELCTGVKLLIGPGVGIMWSRLNLGQDLSHQHFLSYLTIKQNKKNKKKLSRRKAIILEDFSDSGGALQVEFDLSANL